MLGAARLGGAAEPAVTSLPGAGSLLRGPALLPAMAQARMGAGGVADSLVDWPRWLWVGSMAPSGGSG